MNQATTELVMAVLEAFAGVSAAESAVPPWFFSNFTHE